MTKLSAGAKREYTRLLKECVQAHERYESLLPRPVVAGGQKQAATAAFTEADLKLIQDADWQRVAARDALDRFRAEHGVS